MPLISDDFPAPDTPVTATSTPSGNATSMFFRLCSRAPLTVKNPFGGRRVAGTSMRSVPARNFPVSDAVFARSASGVPSATTRPPRRPAPGPKSMTWSADSMVSASCSTTMTLLPRSRSRCSVR